MRHKTLFYTLHKTCFSFLFPPVMLYYSTHTVFHLFYCTTGIVLVCDFVCNLMAFVCPEIKGLLTYLLTVTHVVSCASSGEPLIPMHCRQQNSLTVSGVSTLQKPRVIIHLKIITGTCAREGMSVCGMH